MTHGGVSDIQSIGHAPEWLDADAALGLSSAGKTSGAGEARRGGLMGRWGSAGVHRHAPIIQPVACVQWGSLLWVGVRCEASMVGILPKGGTAEDSVAEGRARRHGQMRSNES
jgi:hypothetical protein